MTTLYRPLVTSFATLVALLVALALGLILGGCKKADEPPAGTYVESWVVDLHVLNADNVGTFIRSGGLRYAQDPTSGNCFAYALLQEDKGRSAIGGAIITWVPCDALMVERGADPL